MASKGKGATIAGAIAALLVIALAVAGAVTYHLEVWGGKTLPTAAEVAKAAGVDNATADDVVKVLESKGFKVTKADEFSGKVKGAFLGYVNAEAGKRTESSEVTVRESSGPGVPEDIVGKQASDVSATLADMGVTVKYKTVPVSTSSEHKNGEIVATSPAAGQALTEDDSTIFVGVAEQNDNAVPLDIVGQTPDDAKKTLEAKGVTVETEARLASKDRVGKVVGADKLGDTIASGDTVKLYVGTDSTGVKEAYADANGLSSKSMLATGKWCTTEGKCITLGASQTENDEQGLFALSGVSDQSTVTANGELISCDGVQQAICGTDGSHFLVTGDTGAFELMPYYSFSSWCGTTPSGYGAVLQECVDGKFVDAGTSSGTTDDLKYRMLDYFIVMPVGSKVDEVTKSGLFDSDALAAAEKQDAVDTSRPFLIYRDASQYDTKETAAKDGQQTPYVPGLYDASSSDYTKVKPAPSNETVYYLVESDLPNWAALADAKV